jgi:hypothetical protein
VDHSGARQKPEPSNNPQALLALNIASSPADEIEDQNDHRDDQQNVNQTAGDVKAEAKQPQNQENYKDCPKHIYSFSALRAPES